MERLQKRPFGHTGSHDYQQNITKIPCRGWCKNASFYYRALDRAYAYLAAVRATLNGGLTLTFVNTTSDTVDLIRRDDDGTEAPIIRIDPGSSQRIVAIASHNFICRNSKLGHCYLLNSNYLTIGNALNETGKVHTVRVTPPRCPMSLRDCAINATAETITNPSDAFKLKAPSRIQNDVYNCKVYSTESREYYLTDDQPGYSSCKSSNTGPWLYPEGDDWTVG